MNAVPMAGTEEVDRFLSPERASSPATVLSQFSLRARLEPSVFSRVVEMFTLRGMIPQHVSCRRVAGAYGEEELHIQVTVADLDAPTADHLVLRMSNIMPVLEVKLQRD